MIQSTVNTVWFRKMHTNPESIRGNCNLGTLIINIGNRDMYLVWNPVIVWMKCPGNDPSSSKTSGGAFGSFTMNSFFKEMYYSNSPWKKCDRQVINTVSIGWPKKVRHNRYSGNFWFEYCDSMSKDRKKFIWHKLMLQETKSPSFQMILRTRL